MTAPRDKRRSLFLTVLMIMSVFAGTVAITEPAAARVSVIDNGQASDVQAGDSSATQIVSFDINTDAASTTETIVLDIGSASSVPTSISTNDTSDVTVEGAASATDVRQPDSETIEIDIGSTGGSQTNATVTVTLTHDTSSISTTTAILEYTASLQRDPSVSTETGGFAIVTERLVRPGGTLFQGEDEFIITDGAGTQLNVAVFERSSGDNEGVPLQDPIPRDQPTGSYDDSATTGTGTSLTVQTARVSSLDINNENGDDVSDGIVSNSNDELTVVAEYNFQVSEALEVTVEDESGLDVTGQALATRSSATNDTADVASFVIDLSQLESGEEYTVTVAGSDDLDFGAAEQSATFEVSAQDDAILELDQDTAVQGENVRFDIQGADEGDVHPVRIDANDLRDGGTAAAVFRDVGDTADTGTFNGDPVALVEIDDGEGVGQIETAELDDTGVDVTLFSPADIDLDADEDIGDLTDSDFDTGVEADEQTLEVTEGQITLDNPTGSYVIGSEVDINGTTSPGVEEVVIYARDEGNYIRVTDITVDGDDTFEAEEFNLVQDSDNPDALNLPGTYRIATLDADSGALDTDGDGVADNFVDSQQVSAAVGSQTSLRVVDQSLTLDTVSITNGQVAVGDEITVEGVAPGQNEVSVSFYGPRGTYDRTTISVDENDEFSADNIQVGNNDLGQPISQGTVVMTVFSNGRDGVTGDGELNSVEVGDTNPTYEEAFANFYQNINDNSLTQQQVIDRVASETTGDTGSDDISEAVRFRLIDAQTSINTVTSANATDNVVVAGETMTVSGVTNRQAGDTDITVEVIEGPTRTEFELNSTDQWGTDGRWSVTLDTTGVEPGNYTVEASDGTSSDVFDFQVVAAQPEPEPTPAPEPTASVTFNDQALSSAGTVTVASVTMSEGGFVTIHDDTVSEDPLGSVVSTSDYLEPGTTQNVEVNVEAIPGQHFAMPHRDTNGNEAYDFVSSNGAEDAPYTTAAGDIVLDGAQISAPSTPTPTEAPTPTATPTLEPEDPTPSSTETGGQPGFGLVVSVLALLGAALLALRRRS